MQATRDIRTTLIEPHGPLLPNSIAHRVFHWAFGLLGGIGRGDVLPDLSPHVLAELMTRGGTKAKVHRFFAIGSDKRGERWSRASLLGIIPSFKQPDTTKDLRDRRSGDGGQSLLALAILTA